MKENKRYPQNPMAKLMSYDTRQKRFNEDKDKLFKKNIGLPARELQEKFDRLIAWWDV